MANKRRVPAVEKVHRGIFLSVCEWSMGNTKMEEVLLLKQGRIIHFSFWGNFCIPFCVFIVMHTARVTTQDSSSSASFFVATIKLQI